MSSPRLEDYLLHMQEAAQQALAFVGGMSEEAFAADTRTHSVGRPDSSRVGRCPALRPRPSCSTTR